MNKNKLGKILVIIYTFVSLYSVWSDYKWPIYAWEMTLKEIIGFPWVQLTSAYIKSLTPAEIDANLEVFHTLYFVRLFINAIVLYYLGKWITKKI